MSAGLIELLSALCAVVGIFNGYRCAFSRESPALELKPLKSIAQDSAGGFALGGLFGGVLAGFGSRREPVTTRQHLGGMGSSLGHVGWHSGPLSPGQRIQQQRIVEMLNGGGGL